MENPFQENRQTRPAMLTVICILTFIGSGWSILSNLFTLFTGGMAGDATMQMEQFSSMAGDVEGSSLMSNLLNSSMSLLQVTFQYAREIALFGLVLSVISLIGAIMMFRMRRMGFYLYTTAQILSLLVLPYFAGFSMLVFMSIFMSLIFVILFVTLYAVNLKYMK